MNKYIKVKAGFAISRKTAWIGCIQEELAHETIKGFICTTKTIKESSYVRLTYMEIPAEGRRAAYVAFPYPEGIKDKENAKYFFKFGDAKQEFTTTCDTREKALEEWERVLCLINEESNKE